MLFLTLFVCLALAASGSLWGLVCKSGEALGSQDGAKGGQDGAKMAQDEPKVGPRWAKIGQDGAKMGPR